AREMEPELSDQVVAALYAPTGGIVCPFGLTIALAENAADNGVEFRFLSEVTGVQKSDEGFIVELSEQSIQTRYLVNAAGVYADTIHNMLSSQKRTIIPRRGEYCLFDKSEGSRVSRTIFQLPTRFGKGVLVTPTVHGNLMIGPNAVDIGEEKEGVATTAEGLADIMEKAALSLGTGAGKGLSGRKIITSFAGLRAHTEENDFTLEEAADVPGLFDALGIESPGLTAAPAIGVFMA
ncbi:MAG: FAD-dependent oxidoreductase, partial [Lachnospiraceae bacterium]|nr:FAD-dependent oxidoreductase [Lachnospiraceae bacterium]